MNKKRMANIELLRIVAMIFVVILHYQGKGGTLLPWGDTNFTTNTYIAWFVQAFALVAVNVYVLIGGYFLTDSSFKISRILKLWLQIFFYSAGIWLIFLALGQVPEIYTGAYWVSMFILPVTSGHYWFASSYIFLCLLAPFLGLAAHKMTKKQLQTCIVILLLLFSRVWRILLPMSTPIDDRGYGILWFVVLFMIAAYIRLYVQIKGKWVKPLLIYVISSVCLFLSLLVIGTITQSIGKMEQFYAVLYEYNAPFTIIGAVALFIAFLNMNIKSDKLGKVINIFASATFGVYLLHEHVLLRDWWTGVWKVQEYYPTSKYILHFIVVVACVYLGGTIVDLLRGLLFKAISKLLRLNKVSDKLSGVDRFFMNENGNDK